MYSGSESVGVVSGSSVWEMSLGCFSRFRSVLLLVVALTVIAVEVGSLEAVFVLKEWLVIEN